MTFSPRGFDLYLSASARADAAALPSTRQTELDALFSLLLDDPSEDNLLVRNISNIGNDSIHQLRAFDLSVFYQFDNPLVIRIIHVSSLLEDID